MGNKGITLLEILVTLVIMAILGSFSLIGYINFTTKAKVQEALQILEEFKAQAIYVYNNTGNFSSYATLFSDLAPTNCVGTCAPGDTTDTKTISAKYITQVTAQTGTNSGGQRYILLSATLNAASYGVSAGANQVFMQGIVNNNQITWQCVYGVANSIAAALLPQACVAYVP